MSISKDQGVESLRGIAIVLLVAAHVIGVNDQSGMKVEPDSLWRYLHGLFRFIRMPLFTMISGYIYSLRPVTGNSLFPFFEGKIRRLLFPLITIGSFQFILRAVSPFVNTPLPLGKIWRIYFFAFDQFWFLQSLFLVFLVIGMIDFFKKSKSDNLWYFLLISSFAVFPISEAVTSFMGLSGSLYLFVFFVFGLMLNRVQLLLVSSVILKLSLIIFSLGLAIIHLQLAGIIAPDKFIFKYIELLSGLAGGLILFRFRKKIRFLAVLGSFSFPIFLFHIIFSAPVRIFLFKINLNSDIIVFMFSLTGGLFFSIAITMLIRKNAILKRFLIGEK